MSKVFRLYNEGTDTYKDWNISNSFPYNSRAISDECMPDPDGAKASKEITSIPSPFARIDLVKNAFKEVFKSLSGQSSIGKIRQCLDGNTIFHKMVSDTLDVGEIFFKFDRYKGRIDIISWDRSTMIEALRESGDEGQICYANALEKYLTADAEAYNYNNMKNIYLLNYINGPEPLNIIGATSPASIFFSTANKIDYIKEIQNGEDLPFDDDYCPLYKRDSEYIKFWFLLKNTIQNFAKLFPEVNSYLDFTYKAISDPRLKEELRNAKNADALGFINISVQEGTQANAVEVLGNTLYQKNAAGNFGQSDFRINSSKQPGANVLVLPVESGNVYKDLRYTTDKWGATNRAPYKDSVDDYKQRRLPHDFTLYPYLTISDFLEDTMIVVPHILNDKSFLAVNNFSNLNSNSKTYLLPLKPLFFEFFTVDDLRQKKLISFRELAGGGIKTTLKIPIKGNGNVSFIEYTRIYHEGKPSITDKENDGGIMDESYFNDFEVLVMPNIRFPQGVRPEYRIASICPFANRANMSFYFDGKLVNTTAPIIRNTSYNTVPKSQTYIVKSLVDLIQISKDDISGLLIPTFDNPRTSNIIEFTVDLGTSNTHIEMILNGRKTSIQSFGFTQSEQLQSCAFLPATIEIKGKTIQRDLVEIMPILERDFLPLEILPNSDYNFPTRTVLSFGSQTNWNQSTEPWADSNICVPFGKQPNLQYNRYVTDIKWSNEGNSAAFAEAYINNLMFLLRCKALVKGATLSATPVTWFYPTSMSQRRRATFTQAWQNAYNKYFGGTSLKSITESLAPVLYFFDRYAAATDMVTVDIGGGTTDIAFASEKNVQYVSSFRFAANTLFEDGFSTVNPHNGIIDFFKSVYQDHQIPELTSLLDEFDGQPANLASTFFTLKDSPIIKNNSLDPKTVDFCHLLREDDNFKVSFLIFYSAIIYHISQIIKAKDLALPRHIAFSGNGSNIIRALVETNNIGLKILSDFTKTILESVSGKKYGSKKLEILGFDQGESPKRATCHGGFLLRDDILEPQKIVLKSATGTLATNDDTYDKIDTAYLHNVQKAVSTFFDFLFHDLSGKVDLFDSFGISKASMKIARENCKVDIGTYIKRGVDARKNEQIGNDAIAETFFFYPIKGVLQTISQAINSSLN